MESFDSNTRQLFPGNGPSVKRPHGSYPTGWSSRSWKLRETAVRIAAQLAGPFVVEQLLEALNDLSWKVRLAAAEELRNFPDPQIVGPMLELCKTDRPEVVQAIVKTLGLPDEPHMMRPSQMRELFQHGASLGKVAATWLILRYQGSEALELLGEILRDPASDPSYRELALQRAAEFEFEAPDSIWPAFLEAAASGPRQIRIAALQAVKQHAHAIEAASLIPMTDDPDPGIAREALETLGKIGGSSARQIIDAKLGHPAPAVRLGAYNALLACDRPGYVAALSHAVNDESDVVRLGVAEGVPPGAPAEAATALSSLLNDPVANVRMAAVAALARSGQVNALGLVAECVNAPPEQDTRDLAYEVITAIGGPDAIADMVLRSGSETAYDRARAVLRLNGINQFDCVDYLGSAIHSNDDLIRISAEETLNAIKDMSSLLRAATDADIAEAQSKELLRTAGPGGEESAQLLRPGWMRSDKELVEGLASQPGGVAGLLKKWFG